ncbi:MAG: hypothetical protein IJM34_05600 [Lachnospiraceae bacterium]|nr:hypothetical protein [Lachnospiraceae bacterium]
MAEEEVKEEGKPTRIEQGMYIFEYVAEAEEAKIEAQRIERLEKQLDYTKPALVLAFYKKALEGRVFKTVEGYAYLVHLRAYLEDRKSDLGGVIPCIPSDYMSERAHYRVIVNELKDNLKNEKKKTKSLRHSNGTMKIVITFLVVALVAMLIIALVSDNPNILNYERVLQDKYSSWEMDLKEREDVIRQKELELKKEKN